MSRTSNPACRPCGDNARRGFSLTELLIAMTIALMVMAAVASLFGAFSSSARTVDANAALADALRAASSRLRYDLTGVTVDVTRPNAPESGTGYFEYIEGPRRDFNAGTPEADTDDVLLFTSRALGRPFKGRYTFVSASGSSVVISCESPYAEIAWFCKPAPDAEQTVAGIRLHRLYRRQMLSNAYIGQSPFIAPGAANVLSSGSLAPNLQAAYLNFDLSLRNVGTAAAPVWAPNSLADLTRRETRFLHNTTGVFPYAFAGAADPAATFDGTTREGEDVVLGNVIGFDVRAIDPSSVNQLKGNTVLVPGDPGYQSWNPNNAVDLLSQLPSPGSVVDGTMYFVRVQQQFYCATKPDASGLPTVWLPTSQGAFVDLGWGRAMTTGTTVSGSAVAVITGTRAPAAITTPFPSLFLTTGISAFQSDGVVAVNAAVPNPPPTATYDTWSMHFEFNGINEDGDAMIDDGTNGLDDNGNGVPDDPAEYETSPPYPVPLRGIEVRIRCYEPSSRQVRQVTVRHTFVKK